MCKILEPITCHEQITRFLNSQPKVPNPNNYLNTSETEAIPPPPKDPGHAASSLNLNPMNHSSPSTTYPAEFSTSTTDDVVQAQLQHDVVQAQLRAISELLEAQSQNRLPLPEPLVEIPYTLRHLSKVGH